MDEVAIIQYMLGLLSQIKLYHWSTMKYGVHKALDKLYDEMGTHIDTFVESFIGRYKKQPLKKFTIRTAANTEVENLITWLESERDTLDKMQKPFVKAAELQNILQEMVADFDTAIYLCKLA
jgi:DNA-binding ferritin-like protein